MQYQLPVFVAQKLPNHRALRTIRPTSLAPAQRSPSSAIAQVLPICAVFPSLSSHIKDHHALETTIFKTSLELRVNAHSRHGDTHNLPQLPHPAHRAAEHDLEIRLPFRNTRLHPTKIRASFFAPNLPYRRKFTLAYGSLLRDLLSLLESR